MPKAYKQLLVCFSCLLFLHEKASAGKLGMRSEIVCFADTTPDTAKAHQLILKPIIGAGIGMFSYFGNVKAVNSYAQNPTTAHLGYNLTFSQKVGYHMEFSLEATYGTLGQYVRSQYYNWNFQSQIGGGGVDFTYKLFPNKDISPFFTLGLESFEFLSTTDMNDAFGNKYYYWTDGSIRSLPQNAPNASSAMILIPDYTYETDIRKLNLGGAGNYNEQTFAIPIGAGFNIHITPKADFIISSTLHYTFTDHIDGLTPQLQGPLHGTRLHDAFVLTAVSFRYDISKTPHVRKPGEIDESRYDNINLDASLLSDTTHTYANADTLPQSDSLIKRQYEMYKDTTGKFATVVYDSSTVLGGYDKPYKPHFTTISNHGVPITSGTPKTGTTATEGEYTIELGHYTKGVPAGDMDKLLSVPDVKSNTMKDSSSVYTAGSYADYNSAKQRQDELEKQGITGTKIVVRKGDDFVEADKTATSGNKHEGGLTQPGKENNGETTETHTTGGGAIIYRVQLGAFKHKLTSTRTFTNAKNVVEMKTENGYYTYSTGSFTNYKDAEAFKAQMAAAGYGDAFVKAYRNGHRIPITKEGTEITNPAPETPKTNGGNEGSTNNTGANNAGVTFRVQLGVFKETPPKDKLKRFKQFSNLMTEKDAAGTHYYVGPYSDYASAKAMKEKVIAAGLKDAFVTAYQNGKQISLAQAMSLIKQ